MPDEVREMLAYPAPPHFPRTPQEEASSISGCCPPPPIPNPSQKCWSPGRLPSPAWPGSVTPQNEEPFRNPMVCSAAPLCSFLAPAS